MSRRNALLGLGTITNNEDWQMHSSERFIVTALARALRPRMYWEVGVYFGGSLEAIAPFCDRVVAFDIEDVSHRFQVPENCTLVVGDSRQTLPERVAMVNEFREPAPELVLIDGSHEPDIVACDLESVCRLVVDRPLYVLMHDASNDGVREGIARADLGDRSGFSVLDLDFVLGRVIEQGGGQGEVWGGLALLVMDPLADGPCQWESASVSIGALRNGAGE